MTVTLYALPTGNCHRVAIMLEELGLDYRLKMLDFLAGDLKTAAFLAINPLGQVPAISVADEAGDEPLNIAESAAILAYLARRSQQMLPLSDTELLDADRWTATLAGLQATLTTIFFARHIDAAAHVAIVEKLSTDVVRYLRAMNVRLAESPFLAGDHYTYVDVLGFSIANASLGANGFALTDYPALSEWRARLAERPAVQRGLAALAPVPA